MLLIKKKSISMATHQQQEFLGEKTWTAETHFALDANSRNPHSNRQQNELSVGVTHPSQAK